MNPFHQIRFITLLEASLINTHQGGWELLIKFLLFFTSNISADFPTHRIMNMNIVPARNEVQT